MIGSAPPSQPSPAPEIDLKSELRALLLAGCTVTFSPLPNAYGVIIAQIKITPPGEAGSVISELQRVKLGQAPTFPFIAQINLVMMEWDAARALRRARRLFVGRSTI
jgi:hypothetical protein